MRRVGSREEGQQAGVAEDFWRDECGNKCIQMNSSLSQEIRQTSVQLLHLDN